MTTKESDALEPADPMKLRDRSTLKDALIKRAEGKQRDKHKNIETQIKLSVFFFSAAADGRTARKTYDLVLRSAIVAEEEGLYALWAPERHFDPFGAPFPDPALLLAAVASKTSSLRLRAGSVVLPLHDPLEVAERWGSLQEISGGRVGVSFATGWNKRDFVTRPLAYAHRREQLMQDIEAVRALWRKELTTRVGPEGETFQVQAYPAPTSEIPLWLTSSKSAATWGAAHRHGANLLTAVLEQGLDQVLERTRTVRRNGYGGEITLMMHAGLQENPQLALEAARDPLGVYLRQHMAMYAAGGLPAGIDVNSVSAEDQEALLMHGVNRYMNESGLFGSAETNYGRVLNMQTAGVTELACLVDFGGEEEAIIATIRELGRLQRQLADARG